MPIRPRSPSRLLQFALWGGALMASFVFGASFLQVSTQGDSSDTYPKGFRGGACTIETATLTIGYSGYYISNDYVKPENEIRTPHLPIQCGKIPGPGILNITIDLLYPETIRDIPLGLRLVKVQTDATEQEILSIPAQLHQSGVITHEFKMSELGQYILYLNGKNAENVDILAHVPIKVGADWKDNLKVLFSTFMRKD
ncbi:MAG: hypothetical protein V9G16_15855 [Nitrosomonas sp.]